MWGKEIEVFSRRGAARRIVMDYVRLGASGLQVSRLCLGCMSYGQATTGMHQWPWTLGEEDGRKFIKRALDLGINFFDTANNYSDGESEAVLGRAIRDFALRDEVVLATKVSAPVRPGPNGRGLSRKAILSEVDKSLQRLCTDYIDLYQIHLFDKETPLEETLSALNDVVRAGKVRYLGAANLHAWQSGCNVPMGGRPSYRFRTCTTFSTARKSGRCCRSVCRKGWEPILGHRWRVGA
jgi:aryl-alcohol dehydrogenase-like predicted oxidoreductase